MDFKDYLLKEMDYEEVNDQDYTAEDLLELIEMLIEDGDQDAISHISDEVADILEGYYSTEEEEHEFYEEDDSDGDDSDGDDEDDLEESLFSKEELQEMLEEGLITEKGLRRLGTKKKGKSFFKGSKTSAKRKRKANKYKNKGAKKIQNLKNRRAYKSNPSKKKYQKDRRRKIKQGSHTATTRRG